MLLAGGRTTNVEHSAIRILLADAQGRHQSSEYYQRAGGPPKSNTVPSECYWPAPNADTNHQNIIRGREDRESRTQCFFFRPSPSRLSPGRNTVFVPLNELCNVLYVPSLGSQKRAWTSTQSNMSKLWCPPGKQTSPKNNKTKQKTTTKNTQNKQ